MNFSFQNAICKRCPYFIFKQCHYKKTLYNKVPSGKSNFKFRHRCKHYRNIFRVGQPVLVNVYSRERLPDGTWDNVLVHENVPGIIKGFKSHKFIIEFFKAYCFNPYKQSQDKDRMFHFEYHIPAKDIKPILMSKASMQHMLDYRAKIRKSKVALFVN